MPVEDEKDKKAKIGESKGKAVDPVGHPFEFPDPDDRSPNDPIVTLSKKQVLGIYNRGRKDKAVHVTEAVRQSILDDAKTQKWDSAKFAGGECILENTSVQSIKKSDS